MKTKNKRDKVDSAILVGTILFILTIYIFDYLLPDPISISSLYVVSVLLTLFLRGKKITFYIAILATLTSLAGFLISSQSTSIFLNLLVSSIGIWTGLIFVVKYKNHTLSDLKNKERLRALFEYATEGILIANNTGEIVMINPIAEKQFGYENGELLGKQIEILIPSRMSERHVKHREKYVQNPYPRNMGQGIELFALKKDGNEFPVEISLSNFETDEGQFVIAFVIDVTNRKQSELLLRKEKEVAQMYLDIAPVIFMVIDKEQKISLINQNGSRILGYVEQDLIGKNWFDLISSDTERLESRSVFNKLLEGEISSMGIFESAVVTSSGENKLISWKNTIIRDEKGIPVSLLSAGEDVTEKKRQELLIDKANAELKKYSDEILQLNADLEQRVKIRTEELAEVISKLENTNSELAVEIRERRQTEELLEKNRTELRAALDKEKDLSELKSRFVTMASHEFRTPLSTILTSVSLIAKYNEPTEIDKRFKHIERIKSAVTNLTSILNDFLSIGKLEEGMVQCNPSAFDLNLLVVDLISEMREVTKSVQTITYEKQSGEIKVVLDKNLTRNILLNLFSNAIKYSNEGTAIIIKTFNKGEELLIEIKDHGIGIPPTEQHHISERFFRAKNAVNIQGTGLGLNIVKKYVALMKGELSFESEMGLGTTFKIKLPTELIL